MKVTLKGEVCFITGKINTLNFEPLSKSNEQTCKAPCVPTNQILHVNMMRDFQQKEIWVSDFTLGLISQTIGLVPMRLQAKLHPLL